jgi:PAS domain S-box-containing protein
MLPSRFLMSVKQILSTLLDRLTLSPDTTKQREKELSASNGTIKKNTNRLDQVHIDALPSQQQENCAAASPEREKLLSRIAEAVPEVLLLYDISRQSCVYVNSQLATTLALTAGNLAALEPSLFENLLYPDDFSLFSEHVGKCAAMADGDVFEAEYRFRHANGEWRWFHYRDTVFTRDSAGAPHQMLCAARDISNHKRHQETLRDQAVQAALVRLVSHVSYEINTPLANLRNMLFLLKNAVASDHPDTKYVQWMEEEIERIAQTLRRLSAPSQVSS